MIFLDQEILDLHFFPWLLSLDFITCFVFIHFDCLTHTFTFLWHTRDLCKMICLQFEMVHTRHGILFAHYVMAKLTSNNMKTVSLRFLLHWCHTMWNWKICFYLSRKLMEKILVTFIDWTLSFIERRLCLNLFLFFPNFWRFSYKVKILLDLCLVLGFREKKRRFCFPFL